MEEKHTHIGQISLNTWKAIQKRNPTNIKNVGNPFSRNHPSETTRNP